MNLSLALLQSSAWLAAGWLGYRFLLRDTRQFALNRAYLWFVMGGAVLLPWISPVLSGLLPQTQVSVPAIWLDLVVAPASAEAGATTPFQALTLLYFGAMALVALRLLRNLWQISGAIRKTRPAQLYGQSVRLSPQSENPGSSYSFFGWVVLDSALLADESGLERVLAHEQAHSRQVHSLDALAVECLCAVFWFNPFCWTLRHSIAENNEFLADRSALQQRPGVRAYAELLLRVSGYSPKEKIVSSLPATVLLQPFHSSQTKRRLIMLSKDSVNRFAALRYVSSFSLILSVLGLSVFGFSATAQQVARQAKNIPKVTQAPVPAQQAQQEQVETPQQQADTDAETNPDVMPEFPGGMEALIMHLSKELNYPTAAKNEGVWGKTIVQFVVDTDGSIRDVAVLKGFNAECDAEAMRVVREMPRWKAGEKGGKLVATQLVLPIQFALD